MSIRARMSAILIRLGAAVSPLPLHAVCTPAEGRLGIVVSFMAVLELAREGRVQIRQDDPGAALLLSMNADQVQP